MQIFRPELEISKSLYSEGRQLGAVHQVFQGSNAKYWLQPIESFPLNYHAMRGFENFVCRNASVPGKEGMD